MTLKELNYFLHTINRIFKDDHGYDWPDCSVPDCPYKANIRAGKGMCYAHSHGLPIVSLEEYYGVTGELE